MVGGGDYREVPYLVHMISGPLHIVMSDGVLGSIKLVPHLLSRAELAEVGLTPLCCLDAKGSICAAHPARRDKDDDRTPWLTYLACTFARLAISECVFSPSNERRSNASSRSTPSRAMHAS